MTNFAVFASGNGSNLQAIIEAVKSGTIKARLALVVSDKPNAFAVVRAQKAGIKTVIIDGKQYKDRESFDRAVVQQCKAEAVEFIVLAGFMRILSPYFIRTYREKIINIHPSLLPSFKGAHAIRDAFESGVKVTGVTVHMVIDELDSGAILAQEPVKILPEDTLEHLTERIHSVEHQLYPKVINDFAQTL